MWSRKKTEENNAQRLSKQIKVSDHMISTPRRMLLPNLQPRYRPHRTIHYVLNPIDLNVSTAVKTKCEERGLNLHYDTRHGDKNDATSPARRKLDIVTLLVLRTCVLNIAYPIVACQVRAVSRQATAGRIHEEQDKLQYQTQFEVDIAYEAET